MTGFFHAPPDRQKRPCQPLPLPGVYLCQPVTAATVTGATEGATGGHGHGAQPCRGRAHVVARCQTPRNALVTASNFTLCHVRVDGKNRYLPPLRGSVNVSTVLYHAAARVDRENRHKPTYLLYYRYCIYHINLLGYRYYLLPTGPVG